MATVEQQEILAKLQIGFLEGPMSNIESGIESSWLISNVARLFFMQGGFAMFSSGQLRSKNVKDVLIQNYLYVVCTLLSYYLFGFAFGFSYRRTGNPFIGDQSFALSHMPQSEMDHFFFNCIFAATSASIVAGAVAERTTIISSCFTSFFMGFWVFAVIEHWEWSDNGWLSVYTHHINHDTGKSSALFGVGMIDFAGNGLVHIVGGGAALVGAWMAGPRFGRFDADGTPIPLRGHNAVHSVLGIFLIWKGWYGYTMGATFNFYGREIVSGALVSVNVSLSAGSAITFAILYRYYMTGEFDFNFSINGLLAGLVSITGSCAIVSPWAAIIIGFVGSVIYERGRVLVLKYKIDDPLDAGPIHLFCGIWGLIATGFFAERERIHGTFGKFPTSGDHRRPDGLFYGYGYLMAAELVGIIVIIGWTFFWMFLNFYILNKAGILRVLPEEEHIGLDISKQGGIAYQDHDLAGIPQSLTAHSSSFHSLTNGGMGFSGNMNADTSVNSRVIGDFDDDVDDADHDIDIGVDDHIDDNIDDAAGIGMMENGGINHHHHHHNNATTTTTATAATATTTTTTEAATTTKGKAQVQFQEQLLGQGQGQVEITPATTSTHTQSSNANVPAMPAARMLLFSFLKRSAAAATVIPAIPKSESLDDINSPKEKSKIYSQLFGSGKSNLEDTSVRSNFSNTSVHSNNEAGNNGY